MFIAFSTIVFLVVFVIIAYLLSLIGVYRSCVVCTFVVYHTVLLAWGSSRSPMVPISVL